MIALRQWLDPSRMSTPSALAGASAGITRNLSLADGAATAIITAALTLALSIGAGFSIAATLAVAVAVLVSMLVGRTVFALCPIDLPPDARAPAELLLGMALLCTAMLIVGIAATLSADISFIVCCAAGVAAYLWFGRRHPSPGQWSPTGLVTLAVIAAVSLVWSWEAIRTAPRLLTDGIFYSWIDFFVHAGFVTQFAHLSTLGGKSMFVAGESIALYHFGSYMLPAAIKAFSGFPAIAVVTTLWGLLGFILMGLGAVVIGNVLHGRAGGVAAVAAILVVPDAGQYLLQNTFFSFHWAQQVFCGSAYGLAIALLSLAFGVLLLGGARNALALALVTTTLVALFRVHVFLLLALAWLPAMYVHWQPERQWLRSACLLLLLPAAYAGAAIAERIPRAPHFLTGEFDPVYVIASLSSFAGETTAWFEPFVALPIPSLAVLCVGILILLTCSFGLLTPVFLTYLTVNRRHLAIGDIVPVYILAGYVAMLVLFPYETSREYQHRPFVLVYAALAIWCSVFLLRAAQTWQPRLRLLLAGLLVPFVVHPLVMIGTVQGAGNTWALTRPSVNFEVAEGLRQAAEFIRSHAALTDVVWSNRDDPWAINTALTERTTFSSIETFAVSQPGRLRDQILARQVISKALRESTASIDQFTKAAKAAGIDWCLLSPDFQLPESFLASVAFNSGGYRVLRTGSAR